ncbi:MAG TPA: hypothetical protein VN578_04595, partial [Candidatus Binatia bacterium]|nr:hypothetical protein [Candidatus Binatia bacterium]
LVMIFALLSVGFFLIGGVSGLLAIVLAKTGQRASVCLRAAGGLLALGLLAAIAVPNFVRARTLALQNNAGLQEFHAATTDLRARAVASLNGSDKRPVDLQPFQQSLDRAAEKTSGDTAAMLKGSAAYLKRLQPYAAAYEQASRELVSAKVVATRTLVQRGQIPERKAIVTKFMQANTALKNYVLQGETNYRQELEAFQLSPDQKEAAVNGFRKAFGPQARLLAEIRDADDRMGHAMLGVLDLFDTNWGLWHYDQSADVLRFDASATLGQYKAFMAEIHQAGTDQATAQKRLAAIVSHSPSTL